MLHHRITQADVAALARVSQATVSLVLNDAAPAGVRISDETRQRVLDAIRITGYMANPMAQRLAGGRNQILGVFTYEATFPARGRDFYGPFLNGIERAAEGLGVDMLLFTSARVVEGRRSLTREGWHRLGVADGCLLLGQQEDQSELQHLLDTNYPFVFIGRRRSERMRLPYVGADYVTATSRQVDRLVRLGHATIAYVGPQGPDQPSADRVEGFRAAMEAHGLPARFLSSEDGAAAAGEIISRGITAVLVAPELHPEELADELTARGVAVPRDLSIIVLGQPHHGRPHGHEWSGFAIPREEMGARAVVLLSRLVEAARPRAGGSATAPVPSDELHQLLPCPDIEGATIAAPAESAVTRPGVTA
ncbi:LacI family DNA-binding transcriptional regulator [Microbacterium sp. SS28]|uniref:LacI family DNA-binding transcriptional regulator n=1 Tax=Microbacterium sp. SS28 TaxID=2919948 RepID=UPI001FAA04D9|nr:LacI family DNA-binding transcriptional regulator [Microbacterium sp. SS28]